MLKCMTLKYYLSVGALLSALIVFIWLPTVCIDLDNQRTINQRLIAENKQLKDNIFAIGGQGLPVEENALEVAKKYKNKHDIIKYKWRYKELEKPIDNGYITSEIGIRRINGKIENSKSTDWKAELDLTVNGGFFGKVKEVGYSEIYGNYIILQGMVVMEEIKGKPRINRIEIRYSHLSQIFVAEGEYIKKGQEIALIGNTGRCCTWDNKLGIWREITERERNQGYGTHLDVELKINGHLKNPFANSTFGQQVRL